MPRKEIVLTQLAIVWLLALTIASFIVQPPFSSVVALALLKVLRDILAVTLLLTIAGAIGTILLKDFKHFSPVERTALTVLLGLAIESVAILSLALLHILPSTLIALFASVITVTLLWRNAINWWHTFIDALRLIFAPLPRRYLEWLRIAILLTLAFVLLQSLAPPTKWDALTYHLAGPKLYLESGGIVSFTENHFLGFPQLTQMLYLWLLIIARPQAAAMLHASTGILLFMLMLGLAQRFQRPAAGWLAIAALLAAASFRNEFTWPYVDLLLAAYIFGAIQIMLTYDDEKQVRLLILAGVLTGCAVATKYTAAGATVGIATLAAWINRKDGFAHILRSLVIVAGFALLATSPWLIKNWLIDGNPVSPFLWETAGYDAFDRWYYLRPGTGFKLWELLVAPVQATIFGQEGLSPYQATIGILLAGLLPFALIGWRLRSIEERRLIINLSLVSIPACLFWAYGTMTSFYLIQTRLLFSVFPALAIIGGFGLSGIVGNNSTRNLTRIAEITTLIVVAGSLFNTGVAFIQNNPMAVVSGIQAEEDYLLQTLGTHYAAMQQVNSLPANTKVRFLWEPRTYFCEHECLPDSLINQWWHDRQLQSDPQRILETWQADGVTHVLIFESGFKFLYEEEPYEPLTVEDVAALDQLRSNMSIVWDDFDSYSLYALE